MGSNLGELKFNSCFRGRTKFESERGNGSEVERGNGSGGTFSPWWSKESFNMVVAMRRTGILQHGCGHEKNWNEVSWCTYYTWWWPCGGKVTRLPLGASVYMVVAMWWKWSKVLWEKIIDLSNSLSSYEKDSTKDTETNPLYVLRQLILSTCVWRWWLTWLNSQFCIYGLIDNLMKFYISRVLRSEVLLLNEILINDADVLFLFYFIKFVISGRDVTPPISIITFL